ncbi:hypothetical protein [Jannaschia sp. LMIT008]|uniref:hypothetical protein n=1 Tax=Jannaschia maritima TaxID=3032585 RepID=UPI00281239AD|nr:hypothetical protein [Jannaschia sp. LMIT008]
MTDPRGTAVAVLLAGIAGAAGAQDVPLRSGEHDGFTRLVFEAPFAADWTLTHRPGAAEIALTGLAGGIDASGVFDRIGRDRVADVAWTDGTLTLDLACDCTASVGQIGSGHIVIDVAPGVPAIVVPADARPNPPAAVPATAAAAPDALDPADVARWFPFGLDGAPRTPDAPPPGPMPAPTAPAVVAATDPVPRRTPRIVDPVLPASPGEVVSLPLLMAPLASPLGDHLDRVLRDVVVAADARRTIPDALPDGPRAKPADTQLRIRDARAPDPRDIPYDERVACEGAAPLRDLLLRDPGTALTDLAALTEAYDPARRDTVRALRDGYLAAGLGAEARHLGRLADIDDAWTDLMADAVDHIALAALPDDAWDCGSATTLLALNLAVPDRGLTARDRRRLAAFAGDLPRARQRDLLPRAADNTARGGDLETAAELAALVGPPPEDAAEAREIGRIALVTQRLTQWTLGEDAVASAAADALALLPTVPAGPRNEALRAALAVGLIGIGELTEADEVLAGMVPPARRAVVDEIAHQLQDLPGHRSAFLAAAMLRYRDDAGATARRSFAGVLNAAGLTGTAAQWGHEISGDGGVRIAAPPRADLDPVEAAWLARDLAGVVAADPDATRAHLAETLLAQGPDPSMDTLVGADVRLNRSRRTAGLVRDLLGLPGDGGDGTDR